MCGIAGIFDAGRTRPVEGHLRDAMVQALRHRGPDDDGSFEAPGIALGFARLSIMDLAGGNQPHSNETGDIVCVCNGEIYNHRALRQELERRGHRFRTHCDVEVLVHLYEDHGPDFVRQLNGQFAFAIYDQRRHHLVLGRDQAGIAPLFHTQIDGQLVFASEIKALLAHGKFERRVDLRGLDQILTLPGLVSPSTMFEGISALPPGHLLVANDVQATPRAYWDLTYPEARHAAKAEDPEHYANGLEERLLASVKLRLDADVPVGLYLSGGLDSSLIGALAKQVAPGQDFHSFSVCFPQTEIDERAAQRWIASELGTIHHEIDFPATEIIGRLRQAILAAEAPLKESYNTCSLGLSALVRETGLKAVLTGEGADELFAGYVGYRLDAAGGPSRGSAEGLEALIEEELRGDLWGDTGFFYERDYAMFRDARAGLYSADVAALLPCFDCTGQALVNPIMMAGRHRLHQRCYADFKLRLADHLLADHGDRVCYANSVEARYPYLDLDLIEFTQTIPPGLLVRDGQEKWLLRQVARKYLPPALAGAEKFSFVAPGAAYLLQQRVDWIDDLLSPAMLKRQNYFDADAIERLRNQQLASRTGVNTTFETDALMLVLSFGIFLETFGMPDWP
jgi:asparagine synthase (glutamine-hydrolysing)